MQLDNITCSTINKFSIASKNNSHINRKNLQKSILIKEQFKELDKDTLMNLLLQLSQDYKQTQQQVQGLQEENQYLKKEYKIRNVQDLSFTRRML